MKLPILLLSICIIVGLSGTASAQFSQPGELDTTFNFGGVPHSFFVNAVNELSPGTGADGTVLSLALQPDGRAVIGGDFNNYNGMTRNRIARLNADGSLDATFNLGSGASSTIRSIALQPDGKMLIGGSFTSYNSTPRSRIARLNANGSLDATFSPGLGANSTVLSLTLQPDGKLLIGGNFTSYNGTPCNSITRLNANGSLDATFNPGTGANGEVRSLALQPDGKLLIGGQFTSYNGTTRNRIARLNSDGSLDATFNPGTGASNTVESLTLQPDGKVLIGGDFTSYDGTSRNYIARLNVDGSLDTSFNSGTGASSTIRTLALQPDGKVLIGGLFTSYNGTSRSFIARLNADGNLDASFNPGTGANFGVLSFAYQPDGKVLIGGFFTIYNGTTRNRIARLNPDGSLDATFNRGTGANGIILSLALQTDGKVLIGGDYTSYNGTTRNRIARLNADGSLDTTFNPGTGVLGGSFPGVNSLALQPDGKVLIGGDFTTYNGTNRNRIARLNADGSVDSTFNPGTGVSGGLFPSVRSIALQPDGKVLIGGEFTNYNGTSCNRIARLNVNGSLDASFNLGTGANDDIFSLALQPDGKVLIGGDFTTYNANSRNSIARLNSDGSLDANFNPGTGANGSVASIAVQQDGKLLIGGEFGTYNGTSRNRIARLNADGSLDSPFNPGTGADATVRSIALQQDGKLLIGGSFATYNGISRNRIARLNSDGSLESLFDPGTGISGVGSIGFGLVLHLTLQPDGKVLIGGDFTNYNGIYRSRIARVFAPNCVTLPSAPTALTPAAICAGGTATITPTAGGANYRFYAASTGGSPLAGGNGVASFTTPTLSSTTTYHVASVSAAGCESSTRTAVTVTVNPLPSTPSAPAPAAICAGSTATITPTAGGANYRFYSASTGGSPLAGGNGVASFTTPTLSTTTTYHVSSVSAAGCESNARTAVTVTVNPLPSSPTATAPAAICAGSTATITPTAGGANYRFYAASTGGSPLAGGNSVASFTTPTLTTTTTYHVASVSAVGCESSTRTAVTVTVNPLPSAPTAPAPAAICEGTTATITPTAGGANYRFYAASTGGSPFAGGNGVASFTTPTLTTNTTYHVASVSAAGCESSTRTSVSVAVNSLPIVNILQVVDTLKANSLPGSYQWLLNGAIVTGATSLNFVPTQSGLYTLRVTSPQGCIGISNAINFIVTGLETSSANSLTDWSVFPIPFQNELRITAQSPFSYLIMDLRGVVQLSGFSENTEATCLTENLAIGMYMLKITVNGQSYVRKVVKE